MGNRGLVLDSNSGGTPADDGDEIGIVSRLALVSARRSPVGEPLRHGR